MGSVQKFIDRFGQFGLVRLALYPITTAIATPIRLYQTLWNCLVLLRGHWSRYPHFNANASFTTLFYWTRALNLYRFGRRGISPYLGLGAFNLSRCFHYSLASLFSFWKAGTVVLLIGAFGWLASFYLWKSIVDVNWLLMVMGCGLISTLFYMNAFKSQNYNILGWLFFPTMILGMTIENWYIVGASVFLASFGSFTVVFISTLLLSFLSLYTLSFIPFLSAMPGCIKLLTHFYPFLFIKSEEGSSIVGSVLKAIGFSRKKAKYKRKSKGLNLGIGELYFLLLTGQFILGYYLLHNIVPILLVAAIGIYLINSLVMRFADRESAYMMIFTIVMVYAIMSGDPFILIPLWLVISPLPLLIGFEYDVSVLEIVPEFKPFSMKEYLYKMDRFFSPVVEDQKVLMAFNDPGDVYEDIFDGYRQLVELPSYVANQKNIHFLPEFWGVFELNYEGAPQIWGREVEEVKANLKYWKADFVVIYQEDNKALDPKWKQAGFEDVSNFDWSLHQEDFTNHKKINVVNLGWWLLRLP